MRGWVIVYLLLLFLLRTSLPSGVVGLIWVGRIGFTDGCLLSTFLISLESVYVDWCLSNRTCRTSPLLDPLLPDTPGVVSPPRNRSDRNSFLFLLISRSTPYRFCTLKSELREWTSLYVPPDSVYHSLGSVRRSPVSTSRISSWTFRLPWTSPSSLNTEPVGFYSVTRCFRLTPFLRQYPPCLRRGQEVRQHKESVQKSRLLKMVTMTRESSKI